MVANKQRGSGLLPYPDKIESFFEKVIPAIPNVISIKTRLGRMHSDEIFRLMPVFNRYPLEEIIIHPRIGIQMYEGKPDLETFEKCLHLSAHPLVYNGDISSPDSFHCLSLRFPEVSRWMLGRGVLINPMLPEIIRNGRDIFPNKIEAMQQFHDALFQGYGEILCGPSHLLERMKGFWKYFSLAFENGCKIRKKIYKTKKTEHYTQIVSHFFENEARWADAPVSEINEWF
jgi:tRNA-dihydrouridine synthase